VAAKIVVGRALNPKQPFRRAVGDTEPTRSGMPTILKRRFPTVTSQTGPPQTLASAGQRPRMKYNILYINWARSRAAFYLRAMRNLPRASAISYVASAGQADTGGAC
jgi:hypothetical protein